MSSGSKDCLRSMLRAHSRGQNSVFYRKRKEQHNVVCFGMRNDPSKSVNSADRVMETAEDDESEDDEERRTRSRDEEDGPPTGSVAAAGTIAARTGHNQYLVSSTENENVNPDGSVHQHLPQKRKSVCDEPAPKRSLRPKPQRTSDDRSSLIEPPPPPPPPHASSSTSHVRAGSPPQDRGFSFVDSTAAVTSAASVTSATTPKVVVKRGFLTLREMLVSHIEPYGLKIGRRPQKKTSMSQQLEDSKKSSIDIETPDSILVGLNIKEILNIHSFKMLPKEYQHKLLSLLPPVDRKGDGNMETALNNEFFASACQEWRERLSDGELTPENQIKLKSEYEKLLRCVDPWKMKHFEDSWGRSPYENSLMERQRFQKMRELHEKMLESKWKKQEEDKIIETAAAAVAAAATTRATSSAMAAVAAARSASKALSSASTNSTATSDVESTDADGRKADLSDVEGLSSTVSAQRANASLKDAKEMKTSAGLICGTGLPSAGSPTAQTSVSNSKTKRDAEERLLQGEVRRYALLLPHHPPSLHRVLAEHGVPVSSNHRKKCNNLVPMSMCISAKRVATSSLAPARCFLSCPLVIPRRHIRFYHHQSRRLARSEQIKHENQLRFEQEVRAIDEHLKRLKAYTAKPLCRMLPVPNEVQELVDEVLGLVESDRIHDYNSYATSSYATSTMGTPSRDEATTIDENFGSELMFSVATDEEPPTDLSDESRPQTAFDNDVVMNDEGDGDADDDEEDVDEDVINRDNELHAGDNVACRDRETPEAPESIHAQRSDGNSCGTEGRDDKLEDDGNENDDDIEANIHNDAAGATAVVEGDNDDQDDDEIEVKIEAALSEDDTREATTPELPLLSARREQTDGSEKVELDDEIKAGNEDILARLPCEDAKQQQSVSVYKSTKSSLSPCTSDPGTAEVNYDGNQQRSQSTDSAQNEEVLSGVISGDSESRGATIAARDSERIRSEDDSNEEDEAMDTKSLSEVVDELHEPSTGDCTEKSNEANNDESGSVICEILDEDCGSDHSENDLKSTLVVSETEDDVGRVQAVAVSTTNEDSAQRTVSESLNDSSRNSPEIATLVESSQPDSQGERGSAAPPVTTKTAVATARDSVDICEATPESSDHESRSGNLHSLPKEAGGLSGEIPLQVFASSTIAQSSFSREMSIPNDTDVATSSNSHTASIADPQLCDDSDRNKLSSPPSSSDSTLSDDDTDIDSSSGLQAAFGNNDADETASDSTIEEVSSMPHHGENAERRGEAPTASSPSPTPPTLQNNFGQHDQNEKHLPRKNQSTSEHCSSLNSLEDERGVRVNDDDTSGRPASFVTGGLVAPPLPPRCRAQASGYSNRRRRRALSCRDLLIAVEQRKKGQQKNGSPCCLRDGNRGEHSKGCFCKLQPMLPCQRCGAFWHSDCIGPSRICSTCLLV